MAPIAVQQGDERDMQQPDTSGIDSEEEEQADLHTYLCKLPSKSDIKEMLREVTSSIINELQDIKRDMLSLATRTDYIETNHSKLIQNQKALNTKINKLKKQCMDEMQRHMDDLENKGRRNNIRVRGVPEIVKAEEIHTALLQIFNSILNKDPSTEIAIDREQRVPKPKGAPLG
ncbi:hypothetical protein XELAEV_18023024mg [Xenopus laevis]|uniref:Uncharacterized protein n=1 Tax=Xenopus laevis TaxID=8355 RepID=A0A974D570_XENLA|nr:hypothetical protein XELAEV_18023024mg [Xenopus laevis]